MIGCGLIMTVASDPVSGLPLARCLWPTTLPAIHPPYSILALLYTRTSGFSATTAAFSSFVRSLTSPVGSIGAPMTIVTPRR